MGYSLVTGEGKRKTELRVVSKCHGKESQNSLKPWNPSYDQLLERLKKTACYSGNIEFDNHKIYNFILLKGYSVNVLKIYIYEVDLRLLVKSDTSQSNKYPQTTLKDLWFSADY